MAGGSSVLAPPGYVPESLRRIPRPSSADAHVGHVAMAVPSTSFVDALMMAVPRSLRDRPLQQQKRTTDYATSVPGWSPSARPVPDEFNGREAAVAEAATVETSNNGWL